MAPRKFFPQPSHLHRPNTNVNKSQTTALAKQVAQNSPLASQSDTPSHRTRSRVRKTPPAATPSQQGQASNVKNKRRALSTRENDDSSPARSQPTASPPQPPATPPAPLFNTQDLEQFQVHDLSHDHRPGSIQEQHGPQTRESSVPTSPREALDTTITLTHMTGNRLKVFNRLASRADLDEHHQAIGRRVFSAGAEEQTMAMMVTILAGQQHMTAIHQDLSRQILELRESASKGGGSTTTNIPWLTKPEGLELRSCIRQMAWKQVIRGDIQGYTATKDKTYPHHKLPVSLYATTISAILASPAEWKKRLLPAGYGKNPNPKFAKAFHTLVNNVLKDIRKEFETILIENIQFPGRVSSAGNGRVPRIKEVIVKLHEKRTETVGGRVAVREDIKKQITHLQQARMAYVRLQACHWALNKADYETSTLWSTVDEKLEFLRGQSVRYRYAFAILCLEADYEIFTGKKTFEELKDLTHFQLPHEVAIGDLEKELDEMYPGQLAGDEGDYQGVELQPASEEEDGEED